jgi:hypothetical protein
LLGFTNHNSEKANDYNHLHTGENDVNAIEEFLQKGPLAFKEENIFKLVDASEKQIKEQMQALENAWTKTKLFPQVVFLYVSGLFRNKNNKFSIMIQGEDPIQIDDWVMKMGRKMNVLIYAFYDFKLLFDEDS